jgi:O-antigen ligase
MSLPLQDQPSAGLTRPGGWTRGTLPQQILPLLPLTLFFPIGWMYAGVLLYLLSLAAAGNYREKWLAVRKHPMLWPILSLSLVSSLAAIFLARPPGGEFWSSYGHYQTYLFLLLFLAAGGGAWQQRAALALCAGGVVAASLFLAAYLNLLPDTRMFHSYLEYKGNKSILLAILLALSCGWLLEGALRHKQHRLYYLLAFAYIALTLVLLGKSRTASLIMLVLCALPLLARMRFGWRSMLGLALAVVVGLGSVWYAASLPAPDKCTVRDMQAAGEGPAQIVWDRGLCTIHQARAIAKGQNAGEDGMRGEIYRLTATIAMEKPWFGHGIGTWLQEYQARAKGLISATMTTPHNDYLLYLTEIGLCGLAALLSIWLTQFVLARKIGGEQGMRLAMLSITMLIGGSFNAILRDALFGVAFMILLAIPLAGLSRAGTVAQGETEPR